MSMMEQLATAALPKTTLIFGPPQSSKSALGLSIALRWLDQQRAGDPDTAAQVVVFSPARSRSLRCNTIQFISTTDMLLDEVIERIKEIVASERKTLFIVDDWREIRSTAALTMENWKDDAVYRKKKYNKLLTITAYPNAYLMMLLHWNPTTPSILSVTLSKDQLLDRFKSKYHTDFSLMINTYQPAGSTVRAAIVQRDFVSCYEVGVFDESAALGMIKLLELEEDQPVAQPEMLFTLQGTPYPAGGIYQFLCDEWIPREAIIVRLINMLNGVITICDCRTNNGAKDAISYIEIQKAEIVIIPDLQKFLFSESYKPSNLERLQEIRAFFKAISRYCSKTGHTVIIFDDHLCHSKAQMFHGRVIALTTHIKAVALRDIGNASGKVTDTTIPEMFKPTMENSDESDTKIDPTP